MEVGDKVRAYPKGKPGWCQSGEILAFSESGVYIGYKKSGKPIVEGYYKLEVIHEVQ